MVLAKRKVVSALERKGFEKDVDGKHIVFTYRTLDGNLSRITTYVSHGNKPKDLDDHLIGRMARQTKLLKKNFERLASCPMGRNEYEKIIRKNL
ncbi:MAG: hypothetical protein OXD43_08050 [Bacteroidetes bacterium]|nr:hypothetical protein [Bacteroidota bacterium]